MVEIDHSGVVVCDGRENATQKTFMGMKVVTGMFDCRAGILPNMSMVAMWDEVVPHHERHGYGQEEQGDASFHFWKRNLLKIQAHQNIDI